MKRSIPELIKDARRVSAPLIAISTPDPAATIAGILGAFKEQPPAIIWDCLNGYQPANKRGEAAISTALEAGETGTHYAECLLRAVRLPGKQAATDEAPAIGGAVLFVMNAHAFMSEPAFVQGVWNLRDKFKADQRTLVLLAPSLKLPPELANDVVALDQPLPNEEEAAAILAEVHASAGVEQPADAAPLVNAVTGLSAFMAEQCSAMALTPAGIDSEALWERKRQAVEQTPGLKVWRGGSKFADIGGLDFAKGFLGKYLRGKKAPRVIVFIDEIEKALAGAAGDTSGTSQDQLGALLSFMQDEDCSGCLLYGPPGTGKSNLAKAAGAEVGTPVVAADLGATKGEKVGQSEAQIRALLKAVSAMGQKRIFFIATCNSLTVLPPELRRRFKAGTFFMDLPTKDERLAIWEIYLGKYKLGETGKAKHKKAEGLAYDDYFRNLPDDSGWTGAEIETCCEYADNLGVSLKESAKYIVPVSKSASDVIEGLRRAASGRFLSASKGGLYVYEPETKAAPTGRAISTETE